MDIKEFKDRLFKKLVEKGEFVEEDLKKYETDFEEFNPTWDIMLEIINEKIEENKPKKKTKKK